MKPDLIAYIDYLLEKAGYHQEFVDKELLQTINQHADLGAKVRAIDIYYKKRGSYAPEKHDIKVNEKIEEALDRLAKIIP